MTADTAAVVGPWRTWMEKELIRKFAELLTHQTVTSVRLGVMHSNPDM